MSGQLATLHLDSVLKHVSKIFSLEVCTLVGRYFKLQRGRKREQAAVCSFQLMKTKAGKYSHVDFSIVPRLARFP